MQFKNALSALAAGVALATSGTALAASDGGLQTGTGTASTGTAQVKLNVPVLVRISNMNDITLDDDGTTYTGTDDVCVFRNVNGNYGVVAQSANDPAGTAGSFAMTDGSGSTVNYSVTWGGTGLTEDTSKSFSNADTRSPSCSGTPNITVKVTSTYEQVGSATATGTHTDTLSLMVTAE